MSLTGKHNFGTIGKTRVTFVEKKVSALRKDFLKSLLALNGFDVIVEEEPRKTEEDLQLYTVAVTDMTFNPTVWVFERRLKTPEGHKVTQDYWNQLSTETNPHYWNNN
ncbi:MAG: hypothetical protein GW847_06065 [Zetaproteobacteria bacterium]|nr:hypothetical protein [Zetaproteobacteria bacterium]OIO12537.1 MAG: hypothetical protein AUJ53_02065 [Flavobacteriaceae bacterium CG1_02_35_72]